MLGVTPDLAIFAKALAAGFPLAALAGKREIMELLQTRSVMHGGTYNANVMSVIAGLATIEYLAANAGAAFQRMDALGKDLMNGLESLARKHGQHLSVPGVGCVFHPIFGDIGPISNYRDYLKMDNSVKSRFYAKLQTAGTRVTARGTWFLSTAHTEKDITQTLDHVAETWRTLNDEQ